MIVATGRDTGRPAYIFVTEIERAEKMKAGRESFTRVFLKNNREKLEYFLDVRESPEEIGRRIIEERHITGQGAKNDGQK